MNRKNAWLRVGITQSYSNNTTRVHYEDAHGTPCSAVVATADVEDGADVAVGTLLKSLAVILGVGAFLSFTLFQYSKFDIQ
jgi:predicted benzoate:H+ symporter BenE